MIAQETIKNIARKSAKLITVAMMLSLSGCGIFGGGSVSNIKAAEEIFKIGVNAYLWQASLDTLSFMPMRSADQQGGIILSEWKVNPGDSNERSKVEIIFIGQKLAANSLKVTVHRQKYTAKKGWQDIAPRPGAAINISKAILMRARVLRRDNTPIV